MKTFVKTLALALTLSTVSIANTVAAPVAPVSKPRTQTHATYESAVYPSQVSPVVNVVVQKEEGGFVQIRFKSKAGETLAERSTGRGKEKVAMKFRIDELPDGVYTVEITNGRDVTTKTIKLGTQPTESPRTIAMN